MDILRGNVLSLTVMTDKILLKTIKVIIGDCFICMPKVIKLFFIPLLLYFFYKALLIKAKGY